MADATGFGSITSGTPTGSTFGGATTDELLARKQKLLQAQNTGIDVPVRKTDDIPGNKTWEDFIPKDLTTGGKTTEWGKTGMDKVDKVTGGIGAPLGVGNVMGGFKDFAYPKATEAKTAFTDALTLTQQMAHGVDPTMDALTNKQLAMQKSGQGAAQQELEQRMAQAGMSTSKQFVTSGMQERTQEAEQTGLLSELAQQRSERARESVSALAQMAVSGRQLESQEMDMELKDKWTKKEMELKEKGMDIDAELRRRALELEGLGYTIESIDQIIKEEFGKADQSLNWAKLALEDEQFSKNFDFETKEKWKKLSEQIDTQISAEKAATFAKNVSSYKETLKFIDLTTPEGIKLANETAKGIFGKEGGDVMKGLDLNDLKNAQFDKRYEDSIAKAASLISSNKDAFRDTNGKPTLFKNGAPIDPAVMTPAFDAYRNLTRDSQYQDWNALNDVIAKGSAPTATPEQQAAATEAKADLEAFKTWANANFDDFVTTDVEKSVAQNLATLKNLGVTVTPEEEEKWKKTFATLATLNVTGKVVPELAEDGTITLRDTQGNVLHTTGGAAEASSKGMKLGLSVKIGGSGNIELDVDSSGDNFFKVVKDGKKTAEYRKGMTGEWTVQEFDADGKPVGEPKSAEDGASWNDAKKYVTGKIQGQGDEFENLLGTKTKLPTGTVTAGKDGKILVSDGGVLTELDGSKLTDTQTENILGNNDMLKKMPQASKERLFSSIVTSITNGSSGLTGNTVEKMKNNPAMVEFLRAGGGKVALGMLKNMPGSQAKPASGSNPNRTFADLAEVAAGADRAWKEARDKFMKDGYTLEKASAAADKPTRNYLYENFGSYGSQWGDQVLDEIYAARDSDPMMRLIDLTFDDVLRNARRI